MEFQYLGTAAAEGIPALFCNCKNCTRSRKIGGRAIRTRSQAIIDGKLLLDFPADTYAHILQNGIDLLDIRACLITHNHHDHLYPTDIKVLRRGFANYPAGYCLTFYGSEPVGNMIHEVIDSHIVQEGGGAFCEVHAYEPFTVLGYTVTPLPGWHAPASGPLIYIISDGEKTILYAHDTNYFMDEVWEYLDKVKPHFDMVSLDCTEADKPMPYIGHMSLEENVKVRNRMIEMGIADEKTVFVTNHFSHNGRNVVYDDFIPLAAKEGLLVSYDGMKLTI